MRSHTRSALIVTGVVLAVVAVWWVRAGTLGETDRLEVAGRVHSDVRTIAAPAITYPTVDHTVGLPTKPGLSLSGGSSSRPSGSSMRTGQPAISGMLAEVPVAQGDEVKAGDVVAHLDTAMLDLGVEQAQAAAARARADVRVMKGNLDTIDDNESDLSSARTKLSSAESQLVSTRAKLVKTRKDLVSTRAKAIAGSRTLEKQIAQLEAAISHGATGTPPPAQILAGMKAKLAELKAGIRKLDAGIKKIDAGLKKIDTGFSQLSSARSQLNTGEDALATAKTQARRARDVLGILAEAKDLAVDLARARRDGATLTSPVDGVVIFARHSGTVAMVGAPVVSVRPNELPTIDTYLTAEQLRRVRIGSAVEVTCDSAPGDTVKARIARIGLTSEFPPTSFPTEIVHMTRATKVTIEVLGANSLQPGTPVDLSIHTEKTR